MAAPVCPKCGHEFFEMRETEMVGHPGYKLMLVQCSKCGAVVGVTDCVNLGKVVEAIKEKVEDIEYRVSYLMK